MLKWDEVGVDCDEASMCGQGVQAADPSLY